MKKDDILYVAKVTANKTTESGISRDYNFTTFIYALDYEDAKQKLEQSIAKKSILFEVTHKLINFELSEPLAPRGRFS